MKLLCKPDGAKMCIPYIQDFIYLSKVDIIYIYIYIYIYISVLLYKPGIVLSALHVNTSVSHAQRNQ